MTWYYLTQQDWNTLSPEIRLARDSGRYLSPEASKKSKRPLINEDRTMLLMWENQGATIGTWRLWTRSNSANYLNMVNPQTNVAAVRANIPWYSEEIDSRFQTPHITRDVLRLTPAQKKRVDRHNRIKDWKDYVTLISGEVIIPANQSKVHRLHTEVLQPILNPDGTSPYRTGFPLEPDNLYVINWNAKAPRIIGNES